jgi:hypothetical protein
LIEDHSEIEHIAETSNAENSPEGDESVNREDRWKRADSSEGKPFRQLKREHLEK